MPAAVSILSDYFGPKSRARALSVYSIGLYLGSGLAMGGGGALMKAFGPDGAVAPVMGALASWRLVFILMGLVGLFVVPLLMGVREPQRLRDDGRSAEATLPFKQMMRELRTKRTAVLGTIIGFALISLGATTVNAWGGHTVLAHPRLEHRQCGASLGVFTLVLGPLGAITGGVAADWLAKRGRVDASPSSVSCRRAACVVGSARAYPAEHGDRPHRHRIVELSHRVQFRNCSGQLGRSIAESHARGDIRAVYSDDEHLRGTPGASARRRAQRSRFQGPG